MNLWGVVVAGGTGSRYGRLKQLDQLLDRRVLDWSVAAMHPWCSGVVAVVPPELAGELHVAGADVVVGGGTDRSGSVRGGLAAIGSDATHVLVHDGARPLASVDLVARVVEGLKSGARAVVPVIAVSDTLRTVDGEPVDRSRFVAVQTPQGFELEVLREAHHAAPSATDDATLLHSLGVDVLHVDGERANLKITEPNDLVIAEALARGR